MWQIWLVIVWLVIAGVCLVIEIMTTGFLVFWLAIGALISMLVSLFTDNILIQTAVFVISSAILIFATKPFVKKFAKTKDVKTNAFSIIGQNGIVTKEIDSINAKGQVKIDGETWSAVGKDDMDIPKGTEVEVLEIKGVKAVVTPVKK